MHAEGKHTILLAFHKLESYPDPSRPPVPASITCLPLPCRGRLPRPPRYHGQSVAPHLEPLPLKAPWPGRPLMWPPVSQRRHVAVTNVSPETRSPMKHLRRPSPALPSPALPSDQASVTELCADIGAMHSKTSVGNSWPLKLSDK